MQPFNTFIIHTSAFKLYIFQANFNTITSVQVLCISVVSFSLFIEKLFTVSSWHPQSHQFCRLLLGIFTLCKNIILYYVGCLLLPQFYYIIYYCLLFHYMYVLVSNNSFVYLIISYYSIFNGHYLQTIQDVHFFLNIFVEFIF